MDDFRSDSCNNNPRMQIESYNFPEKSTNPSATTNNMQELRCYSASYATQQAHTNNSKGSKFKKGKSTNGSVSKSWSFNDPELQRKKRVASYKAYSVEGKVKGSLKNSFRWLKERYSRVVYGWW